MSLISIPGMTEDTLTKLDTAPTGGGLRPFPCDASGWTQQTGVVLKAGIKHFESTNQDNISIQVGNGQYGAELLINLDVSQVPPGTKDEARAQQQNLDTLMKAIKMLGAHTNGKLDTGKLEKAKGMCCAFICKHKGFQESNGRYYHKISYIFKGQVEDIEDVEDVPMPELPNQAAAAPRTSQPARSNYDPFNDDIPF